VESSIGLFLLEKKKKIERETTGEESPESRESLPYSCVLALLATAKILSLNLLLY